MDLRALSGRRAALAAGVIALLAMALYFLLPRLPFIDPPLSGGSSGATSVPATAGEAVTFGAFICAAHSTPTLRSAVPVTEGPLEVTALLVHAFDYAERGGDPGQFALGTVRGTAPDFDEPYARLQSGLGAFSGEVTEVDGTVVDADCDDPDDVEQIVVSAEPSRDDVRSRITGIEVTYDAWGRSWSQELPVDWRFRSRR